MRRLLTMTTVGLWLSIGAVTWAEEGDYSPTPDDLIVSTQQDEGGDKSPTTNGPERCGRP